MERSLTASLPRPRVRARTALLLLIALLTVAGLWRAGALLLHAPLLAVANSYDEVRYSACVDVYPDRERAIPPAENSPKAPYSTYAFFPAEQGSPLCFWSSEWLPDAIVAAAWHASESAGGARAHSVRALGVLKFLILAALNVALTIAWWRRRPGAAVANAALLPLVFADPANTLYASTFYAEFTALIALYAAVGLTLLFAERERNRWRALLLACAAFALGMSKLQHLLLPLLLAAAVFVSGRLLARRWGWQALALLAGGGLAIALQAGQLARGSAIVENIRLANAADVVLTALLPSSPDPQRTLARLRIDPACLAWAGKRAWELPGQDPERACPGIAQFSRAREAAVLVSEPRTAWGVAAGGLREVDSWLAKNLGTVEGGETAPLPPAFASLGRPLLERPALRALLLLMPLAACVLLFGRRRASIAPHALFAALAATTIVSTYAVTIVGDGFADVAKQCHLVFNAALAWCAVAAVTALAAAAEQARRNRLRRAAAARERRDGTAPANR